MPHLFEEYWTAAPMVQKIDHIVAVHWDICWRETQQKHKNMRQTDGIGYIPFHLAWRKGHMASLSSFQACVSQCSAAWICCFWGLQNDLEMFQLVLCEIYVMSIHTQSSGNHRVTPISVAVTTIWGNFLLSVQRSDVRHQPKCVHVLWTILAISVFNWQRDWHLQIASVKWKIISLSDHLVWELKHICACLCMVNPLQCRNISAPIVMKYLC